MNILKLAVYNHNSLLLYVTIVLSPQLQPPFLQSYAYDVRVQRYTPRGTKALGDHILEKTWGISHKLSKLVLLNDKYQWASVWPIVHLLSKL